MGFSDRAKLLGFMFLGRFQAGARALTLALVSGFAAGCADSGNPGGPNTGAVTVTAIAPSSGTTFGGTTVTITGTGFVTGATVLIGGAAATNVSVISSTSISAKTPAHAAGNAEVRVTVGSKSGSLANGFLFTAPVVTPNTAPVISSFTVQPPRPDQPASLASAGDRMSLTASVNDAETPANQLTYEWSATPSVGTFTGTGPAVQWTAPTALTSSQTVALVLTVVERYQEPDANGLPVQREHRVQRSAAVKVHDTVREVSDMAVDFLTLFSNSNIGPEAVLHNFSRTCDGGKGYTEEYQDIVISRRDRVILSHSIRPGPYFFEYEFGADNACSRTLKPTPGDVCVEIPITWTDRDIATGTISNVSGVDFVTGVYENSQWRLGHSRFDGVNTLTGKPVIMDFFGRGSIIKGPRDK